MRTKSRVSFTLPVVDTISTTVDTVYHIAMEPWGEGAAQVDPVGTVLKDSHLTYHLPHCGSNGITNVEGYSRVLYENIFPYVDLHFYSGGFGQKMALVCRPGSSLSQIKLRFNGQDSLNLDLWGSLKLYSDGKFFTLPQAIAYQVSTDNSMVPVPWGATYTAGEDAGIVSFYNGEYDQTKPLVLLIGPPPAAIDGFMRIFVGGLSWDPTFTLENGNGVYSAAGMYGVGDAVIMCFSNEQELYWSTCFGGQEGGIYGDDIRTLALAGTERLYTAGTTYTAYSPTSFFPFTDVVGDDDWFDNGFYPQTDAFTAAFCIEGLLTRIAELGEPSSPLRVQHFGRSAYRISGLLGSSSAVLCDARGRIMEGTRLRASEDTWQLDLSDYCAGVYLVSSPGIGATRILHNP